MLIKVRCKMVSIMLLLSRFLEKKAVGMNIKTSTIQFKKENDGSLL